MSSLFDPNDVSHIPVVEKRGTKLIEYTPELFNDICQDYDDYYQLGYTVCGAQDPAFIYLSEDFGKRNPRLAKYAYVRVIDRFLNSWSSETLLEFSNKGMTEEEYADYDKVMEEEDETSNT